MTNATRIDLKVPLVLLSISAIPLAAGIARLIGLAGNAEISAENARFVAAPFPVIVHILCVGGPLFNIGRIPVFFGVTPTKRPLA